MIQKREVRDVASSGYLNGAGEAPQTDLMTNQEFHPMLYKQHEGQPFLELAGFNEAVDEFFSKLESQKLDLKIVHQVKPTYYSFWNPLFIDSFHSMENICVGMLEIGLIKFSWLFWLNCVPIDLTRFITYISTGRIWYQNDMTIII